MNSSFVPTEENAKKLETWNQTAGHNPMKCKNKGKGNPPGFVLGSCAVNCYTQWFDGSCPHLEVPLGKQYETAVSKLSRYNLILVIEQLSDTEYASAVESFFGFKGVRNKSGAWCEAESHEANKKVPLVIMNNTINTLTRLNKADIKLFHKMSDCLGGGEYSFPSFDESRFFTNTSFQIQRKPISDGRWH